MGDSSSRECTYRIPLPNYRELDLIIEIIIPKDITNQEIIDFLSKCIMERCLKEYVREKSKIGYKSPYYTEIPCEPESA